MAILGVAEQRKIDEKVQALRERTGLTYPQNNLLDIAKALGVEVYFAELPVGNKEVDGIIKWEEGGAKIYINDKFNPTRKTFTLAHELGHYLLHPNEEKLRVDRFNYSLDTKESLEETEANYFAASLLMPKEEFIKVLSLTDDLSKIASYFGVSEAAVKTRIKWLARN